MHTQAITLQRPTMPIVMINQALLIKTYENDLTRLENALTTLSLQHGIWVKWDIAGCKIYNHDKRRAVEIEIHQTLRLIEAVRNQIAALGGGQ